MLYKNKKFHSIFNFSLSLLLSLFSVDASAVVTNWNVPGGSWNVGLNWTSGVPTAADTAIIGNGGTASIGVGVNALANAFSVGGLSGGALNVTGGGTLTISFAGSPAFGIGGVGLSTPGTVTVDGSGSTISVVGSIVVDPPGTGLGTLIISNNALVSTNSTVLVNGSSTSADIFLNSGGTLSAPILFFLSSPSTVTFNGGILQERNSNQVNFIGGSSPGTLTISGGGAIIDSNGFDIGTDRVFSGVGGLTKIGAGTFTLRGNNTYGGTTTISGGNLQLGDGSTTGSISGDTNISNPASTLIFDPSTATPLTYAGVISGGGKVTQQGSGITTLLSANTYTGDTNINGGTLALGDTTHLTASVGGNVNVNAGGTLSGYGSVGGNVTNDGTIAPGSGTSIGTLTIGGNYTQASTAQYITYLGSAGNNDRLDITGTASLDGVANIMLLNGFQPLTPYTILTTAGGYGASRFSSFMVNGLPPSPFLTPSLTYPDGHNVDFEVEFDPIAFERAALTPNQISVADYILLTGGTPGVQALISTLTTDGQFQAAMDQISGATYANQTMALAHVGSWFEHELANRLMAFPSTSDPCCMCPNGQLKYRNNNQAPGGWVSVYGGQDDINAGQVSGLITNSEGVALGYEWPMNCQTKLGLGVGYTHFRGHATDREVASDNGNLLQAGIYGRYERCGWLFGAAADIGTTNNLNTERHVQGAMAVFSPRSHYRANLISEQVVAAYDLLQSKRCWKLRPFVGFINQQVNSDGFTEDGNSGFELNVGSNDYHSARSQLGVLWEAPMTQCVRPFASVDWEHEFADRNGSFDASLVGLPTPPTFHIVGQEIGRDSAAVKAGLNLVRQGRFNLAVLYQGQFASGWQQNGAALEAGFRFD